MNDENHEPLPADADELGMARTRARPQNGHGLADNSEGFASNANPARAKHEMRIHDLGVSKVGETQSPGRSGGQIASAREVGNNDAQTLARTLTPDQLKASDGNVDAVVRTLTPEQYQVGLVETLGQAAAFELPREGTQRAVELGSRDTMASEPGRRPVDPQGHTLPSSPRMRRLGQAKPHDIAYQQQKAAIRARLLGGAPSVTKIGRFQVLRQLGEGGMGVVFAAYDDKLDRKVAIKVLRGQASNVARTRLLREAQALAKLAHPNIVGVHEVGEHEGQIYLAMEFVRGQGLNEWIKQPRPWREVLGVFVQAAHGLDVAHRANLVHRDFKPHNAILSDDGITKVLDFGLARAGDQAELPEDTEVAGPQSLLVEALTHTGAIMGTPAYMSPEQHAGELATVQSDQFSFCVALYEALYGQHPYSTESLSELVLAVMEGRVCEPPRSTNVPQWVRKVVWKGLCVAPQDRHASMAALVEALEADPARQRRRWLLTGLSVVGMGMGSVALAQLQPPEEVVQQVCVDVDRVATEVWGPPSRERVEQAFATLKTSAADATGQRLESAFNEYAQEWKRVRVGQCEAHASGEISDVLYDRSSACLERRMVQMSTLVEGIASGSPEVLEQAAIAVASLPGVENCTNKEFLLAEVAEPQDTEVALKVREFRKELARADGEIQLGAFERAIERAGHARVFAESVDYPPLVGEALIREGTGWMWLRDGEKSIEFLAEAASITLAHGSKADAAEAVAKKLFVDAELNGRAAESWRERWVASSLSQRIHTREIKWLVENNLGVVGERSGNIEFAREHYMAARGLAEQAPVLAFQRLVSLKNLTSLSLVEFENSRAYTTAVEALSGAKELFGERSPQTLDYLNNLAFIEVRRGHAQKARSLHNTASELIVNAGIRNADILAPMLLDRTSLAWEYREPRANALAEEFLGVLEGAAPWLQILTVEVAGLVTPNLDSFRTMVESGVNVGAEQGDEGELHTLRDAAYASWKAGYYDLAETYSRKALSKLSELKLGPTEAAEFHVVHGAIASKLGKREVAIEFLSRGLDNLAAKDPFVRPWAHKELADVYGQSDVGNASTHYVAALAAYSDYDPDHPRLAEARFGYAQVLVATRLDEARGYAQKALWAYSELGDGFAKEHAAVAAWLAQHPTH